MQGLSSYEFSCWGYGDVHWAYSLDHGSQLAGGIVSGLDPDLKPFATYLPPLDRVAEVIIPGHYDVICRFPDAWALQQLPGLIDASMAATRAMAAGAA